MVAVEHRNEGIEIRVSNIAILEVNHRFAIVAKMRIHAFVADRLERI